MLETNSIFFFLPASLLFLLLTQSIERNMSLFSMSLFSKYLIGDDTKASALTYVDLNFVIKRMKLYDFFVNPLDLRKMYIDFVLSREGAEELEGVTYVPGKDILDLRESAFLHDKKVSRSYTS